MKKIKLGDKKDIRNLMRVKIRRKKIEKIILRECITVQIQKKLILQIKIIN